MLIKCLSLWEPWATAMRLGLKRIETRHWFISHRGPLAIQASKQKFEPDKYDPAFVRYCVENNLLSRSQYGRMVCIVYADNCQNVVKLKDLDPIEKMFGNYLPEKVCQQCKNVESFTKENHLEIPCPRCGKTDWKRRERYGLQTSRLIALEPGIPTVGRQGIFDWTVPPHIETIVDEMVRDAMVKR